MISGIGYSEQYPNFREDGYLAWALAQTSLEYVHETVGSLDRIQDHFKKSSIVLGGIRQGPFAETVALDMLGIDPEELEAQITTNNVTPNTDDRILLFTDPARKNSFPSLGSVLGWGGYDVTVSVPHVKQTQRQDSVNPGITYIPKAMGELDKHDAGQGFKLAIIGKENDGLDKHASLVRKGGQRSVFSPEEKLRSALSVLQSAGRLVVSNAAVVHQIRELLEADKGLADEISDSHHMAYLRAYSVNKKPHPIPPLLVFERHT